MEFAIWKPPADVLHCGERWFIKLEVAGVQPDEIEVGAQGNMLHVRGCRRDMLLEQDYFYHSMEIRYSKFERVIELPFNIKSDSLRWRYSDGMLLVELNC